MNRENRLKHFNQTLQKYQGSINSDINIPSEILIGVESLKPKLNPDNVKKWLRDNNFRSWIPYRFRILYEVNGELYNFNVKHFSDLEYETLLNDFCKLSDCFDDLINNEKKCTPAPTTTTTDANFVITNFLPDSYVLLKLCAKNSIKVPESSYGEIKDVKKLVHYETICKKLFDKLNWKFQALIID